MSYGKFNALNQALDIAGSLFTTDQLSVSNEILGLGASLGLVPATVSETTITFNGSVPAQMVAGCWVKLSGGDNSGIYLITAVNGSEITVSASGLINETCDAEVFAPYSLESDLNYARSDRAAIKGVGFADGIPTYTTAYNDEQLSANLNNLAGKGTDAKGFLFPRKALGVAVSSGDQSISFNIGFSGVLADSSMKGASWKGVPCWNSGPYANDWTSTFAILIDPVTGNTVSPLLPDGQPDDAKVVIGRTRSPNTGNSEASQLPSGEVSAYLDLFTIDRDKEIKAENVTPYTWEAGLPTSIEVNYAYFTSLKDADSNAFRQVMATGLVSDADLRTDVDNLQLAVGVTDGYDWLNALNQSVDTLFGTLASPTVTAALNHISDVFGSFNYVPVNITQQTIAGAIQDIDSAIGSRVDGYNTSLTSLSAQISELDLAIGDRSSFTGPNVSVDSTVVAAINSLDGVIGDRAIETTPNIVTATDPVVSQVYAIDQALGARTAGNILDGTHTFAEEMLELDAAIGAMPLVDGYNFQAYVRGTAGTLVDDIVSLDSAIGSRDYSGTLLTDGQSVTESLQALADALSSSHVNRYIVQLANDFAAGTAYSLPAGFSHGSDNGQSLWVFTRGMLRHPGAFDGVADYSEDAGGNTVTFYSPLRANDVLDFFSINVA